MIVNLTKPGKKAESVLERLEIMANLKPGDPWPESVFGLEVNQWGVTISKLCEEAALEIRRYQALLYKEF